MIDEFGLQYHFCKLPVSGTIGNCPETTIVSPLWRLLLVVSPIALEPVLFELLSLSGVLLV